MSNYCTVNYYSKTLEEFRTPLHPLVTTHPTTLTSFKRLLKQSQYVYFVVLCTCSFYPTAYLDLFALKAVEKASKYTDTSWRTLSLRIVNFCRLFQASSLPRLLT